MTGTAEVFSGGGDVGRDLERIDWSATSLGPPESWPQSLVTTVTTLVRSRFSMWMAWGPELTFFCNDAYRRDTLGAKYPWALGRPAREVWAEIWPDIGPRIDGVMREGEATWDEGLLLFLERSGFREETYHTFSYSPLHDDDGDVAGMLCVVTEDTERVISSRRLGTLRDLGAEPVLTTGADVLTVAARQLARNPYDLPFAALYVYGDDGTLQLQASTGIAVGHPFAPAVLTSGDPGPWGASPPTATDSVALTALPADLPTGAWDTAPTAALLVPMPRPGHSNAAGVMLAALNPYRPLDEGYGAFLELVAGQIGAALSSARASEAERRRAESLAELDRAKTAFFTNVSHELRTPLTLLLGPAEDALADPGAPLPAVQRERVEIVQRNALRLLKLVNTLLDFSRLESDRLQARPQPVDVGRLTAELASGFTAAVERAGLTLDVLSEPVDEPVWLDAELWAKVVYNLLSNALKFTFEGTITVRSGPGAAPGTAVVSVSDTGIGIDPAEQDRLFERFYRATASRARTHEGSGIGLALVAELVGLHGGSVSVRSAPGVGSTFEIVLPTGAPPQPPGAGSLAAGSAGADTVPAAPEQGAPAPGVLSGYLAEVGRWVDGSDQAGDGRDLPADRSRVLVVDDNADMRAYVARLLATHYAVLTAPDGPTGLALARSAAPDLILSDVMMPGLDGFGLLAELRADPATSQVPVVLLSARAGEEATVEGLEAGADDYLVKPFSARELLARVRANLELDRVRQVLDRLASNEDLLDQAQSLAKVGSWELHVPTGRVTASAELCRQLQMSVEDLADGGFEKAMSSRAHPEDQQMVRDAVEQAVRSGAPIDYLVRIVTPDGATRTYRTMGNVELDDDGQVTSIRGASQDVTDRLAAESAIAAAAASREAAGREHRIADELQRSLVPRPSFRPDGLALASFYCAGVEGTQVGGDWFDVIELGAGRAALVIGDVMGRGVRAAAVMGQLKAAVRAYARLDLPPHDVLDLLDATVRELGDDQIVTCVYGIFDPADRSFTYATAGHVPPLLAAPGAPTVLLEGASPPLGTGAGTAVSQVVTLAPGSLLALYTDGLVERRSGDLGDGIGRLVAALDPVAAVTELPGRLVDALLPHGPDDDVAILLASVEDRPAGLASSVDIPDDPAGVQRARRFVTSALAEWEVPENAVDATVLVASELVTNAIVHGRPPVALRMRSAVGSVVVEVSDAATVLPRPVRATPDDEHGRGLQIVSVLAERWGTRTTAGGKVVWCQIPAPPD